LEGGFRQRLVRVWRVQIIDELYRRHPGFVERRRNDEMSESMLPPEGLPKRFIYWRGPAEDVPSAFGLDEYLSGRVEG
jgi:hypothetical protein